MLLEPTLELCLWIIQGRGLILTHQDLRETKQIHGAQQRSMTLYSVCRWALKCKLSGLSLPQRAVLSRFPVVAIQLECIIKLLSLILRHV